MSVGLPVYSLAYLKNHTPKLHEIPFTRCQWLWLEAVLTTCNHVLPVLKTTSFFHIMQAVGRLQKDVMFRGFR